MLCKPPSQKLLLNEPWRDSEWTRFSSCGLAVSVFVGESVCVWWLTPPSRPSPQGSPSSKRRGPLLQPIIEGETALFFDDIKVKSCSTCFSIQWTSPCSNPSSLPSSLPAVTSLARACWLGGCRAVESVAADFSDIWCCHSCFGDEILKL